MLEDLEIKLGEKYVKSFEITTEMINGFALSTGDANPLHMDEEFASSTVFKKRIAHGFLIGSLISTVLGNDFPGNGTIYISQNMKFRKPVFIGDKISVIIVPVEISGLNWLKLKTNCFNQDNILIIEGEALVIPPKNCRILQ
jgi:3-hydroxybutyryl-CoA dehydratase